MMRVKAWVVVGLLVAPFASSGAQTDSTAATAAFLAAETRGYAQNLITLRREYLSRASWADLGDRCNPGALRVFSKDTTPELQKALQAIVERMEQTIVLQGAGNALAAPEARALLRVVVGWEAGIDRPRWDEDGVGVHRAVATGLTGDVPDPTKAGCLPSPVMSDTVTFVVPGFADMDFPKAPRPRVKAYFGPQGQQRARDEFFAAVGAKNPSADLSYIVVAPIVIWRDYAVVGVNRPREKGGIAVGSGSNGGATYLLRRVGGEWRLLSIVRSWGA
ncbi:hypothetical protein [Gemmatimonas groenlandica]|uniref:DUF4440 domain-containing protein n=1 Tax=Gemmatimonas groenlandica TaxID=2732249 RepID=A0A6M4ITW7_9BACT|nr:hypothetical protein [Gemmatimonas groenlandica]QJR36292.1 hypothetical protein HKW67_12650 [Gemmatimonas groenlandica]